MSDSRTKRWQKTGLKYLAFGTAAATTMAGVALGITASNADQPTAPVTGTSAAHSHFLYVPGLGLDVAGAALANSEFPSDPGPNREALNATLLDGLVGLDLGSLTLPLLTDGSAPGLVNLGSNIGLVQSYAGSPSDFESLSASGAVTNQGSIDLDLVEGEPGYAPAHLDLTALFSQLNITGLTDDLLDGAKIEFGVLASQADKAGGDVNRQYAIADLNAELSAPILGDVTGSVDTVVGTAGNAIDALLGPTGTLTGTVKGLAEAVSVSIPSLPPLPPLPQLPPIAEATTTMDSFEIDTTQLVTTVRTELLNTSINNATLTSPASIVVDLQNGLVMVDLEQLLIGPDGKYAGATLNPDPPMRFRS